MTSTDDTTIAGETSPRERSTAPRLTRVIPTGSVRLSHSAAWQQWHWTSRMLHRIGEVVAHSLAGIIATALASVWAVVGLASGFPPWWQTALYSVAGSVTFVMVFVIQHTNQRQTAATQRKLDELLRSSVHADDRLIAVEEATDEALLALTDSDHSDHDRANNPRD